MIQVKVIESILSNLMSSVMNINENSKRKNSFMPTINGTKSRTSKNEQDSLQYNLYTNDDIDLEENNLSKLPKNVQFDKIQNQSKNQNMKVKSAPLKQTKSEEISHKPNVSDFKITESTINHQSSSESLTKSGSKNVVSLIIDRLKKDFEQPINFIPRIRAQDNWKPNFITNCLQEINQVDEQDVNSSQRKTFPCLLEKPRIYSIGLKYKSKTEEGEKRQKNRFKSTMENLFYIKSRGKEEIFRFQPSQYFLPDKSCFLMDDVTIKCGCIQCSRSKDKAVRSFKSSCSITEPKYRSLPSFHKIEGAIKIGRNPRKRHSHQRHRKTQNHVIENSDNCAGDRNRTRKTNRNNIKKETTSSDEEEQKIVYRKQYKNREEKNIKKASVSLPTSIIFYEDTLTEKLNQDSLLRKDYLKPEPISVKSHDSDKLYRTELRKLDRSKISEDKVKILNSKDDMEKRILKNIKRRIDDDIDKNSHLPKSDTITIRNRMKLNDLKPFGLISIKNERSKSFLKKVPTKSIRPLRSVIPIRVTRSNCVDNSDIENTPLIELKKPNLLSTSRSSKQNLIDSVDSGVITDFSVNDLQTEEASFRSINDSFKVERNNVIENKSEKRFPSFDSDSDGFWSDTDVLNRKVEKAVKRFTEELILCERRIKARLKSQNMFEEEKVEKGSKCSQRRKLLKTKSQSSLVSRSTTSSQDFSKTSSQLSSEEDCLLNISTPSLPYFTDSEYEKSS